MQYQVGDRSGVMSFFEIQLQFDMPEVINCQFHEFAVAPLRPVHFLSMDEQSGIHCLIICGIQLWTPNNLEGT